MKLAFVVQRYGADFVGGAEKYVASMATGLAAGGHDVTVIASCATSYEDWADVHPPGCTIEDGVTVHRMSVRTPRDNDRFIPLHLRAVDTNDIPLWPWAQDRWSQTMGPDMREADDLLSAVAASHDVTVIVGYHYSQSLRLTAIAAAHGPTAVVPTAHPEGAFHVGRVRQMFEHADRIICLAPEEADLVARNHGCRERIDIVGCPVDPIAAPDPAAITAVTRPLGVTPGRYGVVVGRVDPAKGSDDATRFAAAYRRHVDRSFQLVVVGPGGVDGPLVEGIIPTGFVDDATKTALVAGAGVLIQPSYMESFSLILIEGWLLRRPALVQARSSVLAGHVQRSGGGFAYHDYADFEAGLTAILRSPVLADDLGRLGHDYARHEFAWERVEASFLDAVRRTAATGTTRLARRRTTINS